jgi:thiol-disulfide isomerase/thioredoxin
MTIYSNQNFMRLKVLLFFLVIFMHEIYAQEDSIPVIKGIIICNKPQWAVLNWYGENHLKLDSVFLKKGKNQIYLKGKKSLGFDEEMYTLKFEKKRIDLHLKNQMVTLQLNVDEISSSANFNARIHIFGSPETIEYYEYWNTLHKKYISKLTKLKENLDSLKFSGAPIERIKNTENAIDSISHAQKKFLIDYTLSAKYSCNAETGFYGLVFHKYGLENYSWVVDSLEKRFPKSLSIKEVVGYYKKKLSYINEVPSKGRALQFSAGTINNKTAKLIDYKGNFLLLDFWATWCTPCIKEMPNTIEIQKKYADKGLKVITISIDKNRQAWLAAIEEHNMQSLINLHDEKGEAAKAYNVSYVPLTVLINPEGKIIGSNIRGEELEKKLEQFFNKQ